MKSGSLSGLSTRRGERRGLFLLRRERRTLGVDVCVASLSASSACTSCPSSSFISSAPSMSSTSTSDSSSHEARVAGAAARSPLVSSPTGGLLSLVACAMPCPSVRSTSPPGFSPSPVLSVGSSVRASSPLISSTVAASATTSAVASVVVTIISSCSSAMVGWPSPETTSSKLLSVPASAADATSCSSDCSCPSSTPVSAS
mmetsp:Transcript_16929/g.25106  ORF Transcript_16929/g.25106 Transcript_16929/m.25106 type:complete len:201 (-) Transcript_16929:1748-2350(-)